MGQLAQLSICFGIGIIDKGLNLTLGHAHLIIDEIRFLNISLCACVEN